MKVDISIAELDVLGEVRKLKPYGKLEVFLNQNGKELTVILTNPERLTVDLYKT